MLPFHISFLYSYSFLPHSELVFVSELSVTFSKKNRKLFWFTYLF